jgi:hypothetical protein
MRSALQIKRHDNQIALFQNNLCKTAAATSNSRLTAEAISNENSPANGSSFWENYNNYEKTAFQENVFS